MFSFRFLFLLFVLVPFVEIYLLIKIGSVIGAPWTIFFVVLTAVIGAWLVRIQGLATLFRVQSSLRNGSLPAMELIEGAFLLLAGALLLTPGFFTDAVGFALLTPPLRRAVARHLVENGVIRAAGGSVRDRHGRGAAGSGTTIEGEFRRVDDR
jgi:UPF0716 protein FxsA